LNRRLESSSRTTVTGYVVKASCTGGTTPHVNRVRTVNMNNMKILGLTVNSATREILSSNCPTACCGKGVFTRDTRFLKLHGVRLDDWTLK